MSIDTIAEVMRERGAVWIDCAQDSSIGFDAIICYDNRKEFIVFSDGRRPPTQERKRRNQLSDVGVTVHIIENATQALRLIGALT